MSSSREYRVADFIREQLADVIRSEMRDPRVGLVSVTDARVSRDLSYADIYITTLDAAIGAAPDTNDGDGSQAQARSGEKKAEIIEVLTKAAGFLRSAIAKRHTMRTTPQLRFHYDDLIESGPRLEALIGRAIEADEANAPDDDCADSGASGDGT